MTIDQIYMQLEGIYRSIGMSSHAAHEDVPGSIAFELDAGATSEDG